MNILFLMIPVSIFLALFFLALFIWSNQQNQFEDLVSPAHKLLEEDDDDVNIDKKEENNNE